MIEKYFINQAYNKVELEEFFAKKLSKAGFNKVEIVKTPVATKVVIYVARPGLAIGYSGKNIKFLNNKMESKFKLKNPHIEVKGIEMPEYDVKYRVDSIINGLEKGTNWRLVAYRGIKDLYTLPLMGFELLIKGKLMAKGGRKQKYRVASGYMKKVGAQLHLVKEGKGTAYTKAGAIGITLRLIPPNTIFPDKISKDDIYNAANKLYKEMTDIEQKAVEKIDKEFVKEEKELNQQDA